MVTNQGKTITHSLSMVDLRLLGSTSRDRFPATLLASTADIRDTTRARLDLGVPRLTLTKVLGLERTASSRGSSNSIRASTI